MVGSGEDLGRGVAPTIASDVESGPSVTVAATEPPLDTQPPLDTEPPLETDTPAPLPTAEAASRVAAAIEFANIGGSGFVEIERCPFNLSILSSTAPSEATIDALDSEPGFAAAFKVFNDQLLQLTCRVGVIEDKGSIVSVSAFRPPAGDDFETIARRESDEEISLTFEKPEDFLGGTIESGCIERSTPPVTSQCRAIWMDSSLGVNITSAALSSPALVAWLKVSLADLIDELASAVPVKSTRD